MPSYSSKEALNEMRELESKLLARTEELLKNKNARGVANILLSIENEMYQTEREARRLRLKGELDQDVYKTLVNGYVELEKQIMACASKFGLERDVKDAYLFYRIEMNRSKQEASL